MNRLLAYTIDRVSKHLENSIAILPRDNEEERMPKNKSKIRRTVVINGVNVWITADSEQEYADKLLRVAGNKKSPSGQKHPFKDYSHRWFEVFSKPNVSSVTAYVYESQLRTHINPILGGMYLEDIRPDDVQRVFNNMPKDTKTSTKTKTKIVLNQIFKMALDEDLIVKNPLQSSSVKIKGLASTETPPYTIDQMRHMAAHLNDINNPTERAWLAISLSLPLRPEEVLGLLWEDIDEENHILYVRNTVTHPHRNAPEFKPYAKTASSIRSMVIPQEVLSYLPRRGEPKDFVIGGKMPLSYTRVRGMCRRITEVMGFKETILPRRFRTTEATDISAMTHDLKLVQKMLGHSTPQMTLKHYDKGRGNTADATEAVRSCYGLVSAPW